MGAVAPLKNDVRRCFVNASFGRKSAEKVLLSFVIHERRNKRETSRLASLLLANLKAHQVPTLDSAVGDG
jgi:hypothetical protein